uniref:Retrotransposon protein, putative, unclassified n=2 Tax=Oryza sativa subsp. japonica TaxID=39947 RepID=Q7G247_ORYSJ|nr:retrotransposon protein, putative, unclassified [Oryza sativa Japonica Group]AAP54694.1 retrotransposon protein, putative, unclassified [Oryza sativa Japonica Group]
MARQAVATFGRSTRPACHADTSRLDERTNDHGETGRRHASADALEHRDAAATSPPPPPPLALPPRSPLHPLASSAAASPCRHSLASLAAVLASPPPRLLRRRFASPPPPRLPCRCARLSTPSPPPLPPPPPRLASPRSCLCRRRLKEKRERESNPYLQDCKLTSIGLFGPPDDSGLQLDENKIDDIPQVSQLENEALTQEFTEDEIKKAIFQMEHNKAPGPDGFPAEFYQVFWNVIKSDLLDLFIEFHNGTLPLFSLNFGPIILLPKCMEAMKIQQYRPICLLNVSFKIFTKVATNRIIGVAQKVISPTQTAFIPGRNIMEGVVILHETIYELHRKNKSGVIFKIDFKKAFDKVKWSFVQQTLRMKGFSPKRCQWIASFIQGGHVGIKVNDQVGNNFQTYKGLRQGDPLSPILFNIVADMLALLIKRAKDDGMLSEVIPHLMDDGLSILQYADDTIIFLEHDLQEAKNLKLILTVFEKLSGLKINFHKKSLAIKIGRLSNKELRRNLVVGKVVFRATHWLRSWAQLQKCEEDSELLKAACRILETTVMQLFVNFGWRFTNRIQ